MVYCPVLFYLPKHNSGTYIYIGPKDWCYKQRYISYFFCFCFFGWNSLAPGKYSNSHKNMFLKCNKYYKYHIHFQWTWWRHQMETFSALLAICAGNSPVPGEFPAQRPVTRSFDVFFDLRLNKRLSKQSWSWWFETLPRPLWRHSNEIAMRCMCHSPILIQEMAWCHQATSHYRIQWCRTTHGLTKGQWVKPRKWTTNSGI